jgi:glyceraldehyde 3-phosphate dehydrogenase
MTRVGINGFGRMGRLVVRALENHEDLELVHINEHLGGVETAAHLLEFDSVHGRFPGTCTGTGEGASRIGCEAGDLILDGQPIGFTEHETPAEVPWDDAGVELVLECTGSFRTVATLEPYLERGVRRVVVAAPVKDDRVLNVVMGCNDDHYDAERHQIVTAASDRDGGIVYHQLSGPGGESAA